VAYREAGRCEEAIAELGKLLRSHPDHLSAQVELIHTYSYLGREEEPRAHAAEVLRINSKFFLEDDAMTLPFKYQADRERLFDALRKAGLK
jgi:tetratricopeptide (TPR) repeat protein